MTLFIIPLLFLSSCISSALLPVFCHLFYVSLMNVSVQLSVPSLMFLCLFQMSLGDKPHYQYGQVGWLLIVQFSWHLLPFWLLLWLPLLFLHGSAEVDSALSHWSDSLTPPVGDDACVQRVWDLPHQIHLGLTLETDHAPTKARLYPVSTPESGAWLPLSAMGLHMGLRMDDATIWIAVGLSPLAVLTPVIIVAQQCMTLLSTLQAEWW